MLLPPIHAACLADADSLIDKTANPVIDDLVRVKSINRIQSKCCLFLNSPPGNTQFFTRSNRQGERALCSFKCFAPWQQNAIQRASKESSGVPQGKRVMKLSSQRLSNPLVLSTLRLYQLRSRRLLSPPYRLRERKNDVRRNAKSDHHKGIP